MCVIVSYYMPENIIFMNTKHMKYKRHLIAVNLTRPEDMVIIGMQHSRMQ